ncbi:hypothetical protein I4U23_017172 [Adineta vaga]|nr:hypothetical protein I4U23_017172 [Adineta vaga]
MTFVSTMRTPLIQGLRMIFTMWQQCIFFLTFFLFIISGSIYRQEMIRLFKRIYKRQELPQLHTVATHHLLDVHNTKHIITRTTDQEESPLEGYFCGCSFNHRNCPSTSSDMIDIYLKENVDIQLQLRESINQLKILNGDTHECEKYIDSISEQDRLVLIVNDRFGREIIPNIHTFRKISAIYIYDNDKTIDKSWIKQFKKVKGIFAESDELINKIRLDQESCQRNKVNEPLTVNILNMNTNEGLSTSGINGQFINSQLLIDCILRMKFNSTDKDKLISLCKQQYENNTTVLNSIDEFEHNYLSDHALSWYTRDTFLYRMLNKALRVQNIECLFLFRFFIQNIQQQLEQNQYTSTVRLYRGQRMSNDELSLLYISNGEVLENNIQRVLFEIDADPQLHDVKPFADINSYSAFPDEEEVLLMLGSIFRLENISMNEEGIWIIQMTLCSDNDNQLKPIFDNLKKQYGDGETGLLAFGNRLHDMGKFDDADKYYHRLLNELSPDDHQNIATCYHVLGIVAFDRGDYELSLEWYHKSLELKIRTFGLNDRLVGNSHNSIGNVHLRKGDYEKALESYQSALMIFSRVFGEDSQHVATCFNNMGHVYIEQKEYQKALDCYQKDFNICQKHLPNDHHYLGESHNNIGDVYERLGQYDVAVEHFDLSLEIYQKSLSTQHPNIDITLANKGLVYERKKEWQNALMYLEQAIAILRTSLPTTHPMITSVEQDIQRVSTQFS